LGIYGSYYHKLSNEEKFVLADIAACKVERATGKKMTPKEYEAFVWDYITVDLPNSSSSNEQ
jgi:hypothetical protein